MHRPPLVPAAVGVGVGVLAACQSRVNGELAATLDNSFEAAVVSFGSGLVILVVIALALPRVRAGLVRLPPAVRSGELAFWMLLGGLAGGFFVIAQSVTVPAIGVALFTVGYVAGQTANSLLVDRIGLGPGGPKPVSRRRVVASVVAVAAVGLSVSDKIGGEISLPAVLLCVAAGAGMAAQQAVNGRVSVASGQPVAAAFVNFMVGTAALCLVLLVVTATGARDLSPLPAQPWWMYSGGAIGVVFIALGAWVVRPLGVLLFGLCQIAGAVTGALVIDLVAPAAGQDVTVATVAGVALTLVAVAVGAGLLPWRRAVARVDGS